MRMAKADVVGVGRESVGHRSEYIERERFAKDKESDEGRERKGKTGRC